jgi:hypothetical protein
LTIDELLNQVTAVSPVMPPVADSAYLVSRKPWNTVPDRSCEALYVGGNTGIPDRFRTRVGDLIADMFGFYSGSASVDAGNSTTGHHSGGQSLNKHCKAEKLNPKALYIGWLERCECKRCAEITLYEQLRPKLNKKRPSECTRHSRRCIA